VRAGLWEPRVFIGVPLVICFFSYLFSFCVLMGLLTRSTLAAVLLTMLYWFVLWGTDRAEVILLLGRTYGKDQIATYDLQIKQQRGSMKAFEERLAATTQPTEAQKADLERRRHDLDKLTEEQASVRSSAGNLEFAHKLLYQVKTVLPKTRETDDLLNRSLLSKQELAKMDTRRGGRNVVRSSARSMRSSSTGGGPGWADPEVIAEAQAEMRSRSVWWVIGTSLLFEAVVLAAAACVFCRRDY
jgi:hypothetical protein